MEIQEFINKLNAIADIAPKSKTGVHLRVLVAEFNNSYIAPVAVTEAPTNKEEKVRNPQTMEEFLIFKNNILTTYAIMREENTKKAAAYRAQWSPKLKEMEKAITEGKVVTTTTNKGMKKCSKCGNGYTSRDCMNPACTQNQATNPNRIVKPTCKVCRVREAMTLAEAKTWRQHTDAQQSICDNNVAARKAADEAAKAAKAAAIKA